MSDVDFWTQNIHLEGCNELFLTARCCTSTALSNIPTAVFADIGDVHQTNPPKFRQNLGNFSKMCCIVCINTHRHIIFHKNIPNFTYDGFRVILFYGFGPHILREEVVKDITCRSVLWNTNRNLCCVIISAFFSRFSCVCLK